jgi:diamine N-acetyltransferase
MDVNNSSGELGIAITAVKQNAGHGTEAVLAMIEYGTQQLGLKRIFLRTNPQNSRAIHVYQKCGFKEYDRTNEHIFMELNR